MVNVSELSGLPLRRAYCEAAGYKLYKGRRFYVYAISKTGTHREFDPHGFEILPLSAVDQDKRVDLIRLYAPPVESDASVSERELDELCKQHGWHWEVSNLSELTSMYFCEIRAAGAAKIACEDGSDASEARARAMTQALLSLQEKH